MENGIATCILEPNGPHCAERPGMQKKNTCCKAQGIVCLPYI